MKRQYLGDSKDSFKWDYLDTLTSVLGYTKLNITLMLTPDDGGNDGKTSPERFPARPLILEFCHNLRRHREFQKLRQLPSSTGASYTLELHKPDVFFSNSIRKTYFSGYSQEANQLIFLDPDNGFEPEKNCTAKHVGYSDIEAITNQIPAASTISVFQHFRRIPFAKDFSRIKERIGSDHVAALYWHSLMFVTIASNRATIAKVIEANHSYANSRPVVKTLQ
jgi:hypothetical protein